MKPLSHSSYLRLQFLCKSFYDVDEKLHLLGGLSLDDLKEFIPQLRSQVKLCSKYFVHCDLILSLSCLIEYTETWCEHKANLHLQKIFLLHEICCIRPYLHHLFMILADLC